MLTMGRLQVMSGRAGEAVRILGRALELAPGNVDAKVWLSRAYEMAGQFDESDRYARAACEERPQSWLVHDRKAVLDFRRGRYEDAARGWRRVLDLTPDNAHARTNLGSALFELRRLEESEQAYRAAIDIAPTAQALDGLGLVCFYRGSYEESERWFRRAVDLAPAHSRFWGNLADAQRFLAGRRETSNDSFDRAIGLVRCDLEANPTHVRAWAQLAVYLAKRELHAEALAALRRAGDLGTESSTAQVCAVVVHELAGRRAEAIAALRQLHRAAGSIPFELVADPELADLRATRELRDLFPLPPRLPATSPPNPRTPPCRPQRFPSASQSGTAGSPSPRRSSASTPRGRRGCSG
jgi:tetratricopeptide (TPR) repeat protein